MTQSKLPPEPGQLVLVRHRPAIVTGTQVHTNNGGTLTIVNVEYLDKFDYPESDYVVWEVEPVAHQLENAGWPPMNRLRPDQPRIYQAYVDSVRWTSFQSIHSVLNPSHDLPLLSPWSAAIQIEDYQMTPLLRALSMPRVSLLLADDVGLGKTIQAGLIATELIIRRRIRRILVLCPASLQDQWQEEMHDKFHLDFVVMDADEVRRIQRELGSDVNPWAVHNRIITSIDYLRQEVIYQSFEANTRKRQQEMGGAFAPWDLLIVDEAHNLAPKSLTDESLRTRMMRRLGQWFEHRIFLSATPHNGYTHSFTGLLELLDPFRFVQKPELNDTDRRQIEAIMVRRLKREINQVSSVQRFPHRTVRGVAVSLGTKERQLFKALRNYREQARERLSGKGRRSENRGRFIFSLLSKRLLSSPYAFARTWWRHIGAEGFVSEKELDRALRQVEEDISDDEEREARERYALAEAGAWLFGEAPILKDSTEEVSEALRDYGWTEDATLKGPEAGSNFPDAKVDALLAHLRGELQAQDLPPLVGPPSNLTDERVIIFTEYKDTLNYLLARLAKTGYTRATIRHMYGGMSSKERREVKKAFTSPGSPMRILIATDVASEGLNLQEGCRYVCHYEIPWNPMRLEQRNGRVDRYGQAHDVHVFHYTSREEEDQAFLARVAEKVHEVRDDLGSVSTVIDEGVQLHFWGKLKQDVLFELIDEVQSHNPAREDFKTSSGPNVEDFLKAQQRFERASKAYNIDKDTVQNVIESYLVLQGARFDTQRQGFRIVGAKGRFKRFLHRVLADEGDAMPLLVFDPAVYLKAVHGRTFFRPIEGTQFIRLGHPLAQVSMGYFRRAMWGQEKQVHRWTILGYRSPAGTQAFLELQFLLTGRNQLQEVIESTMGSWWFHVTPQGIRSMEAPVIEGAYTLDASSMAKWWNRLKPALLNLSDATQSLQECVLAETRTRLEGVLRGAQKGAGEQIREQFQRRIKELEKDMGEERKQRLQMQLIKEEERVKQLTLDPRLNEERRIRLEQLRQRLSEEDLHIWDENMRLLKDRLDEEHRRFKEHVFPKRFALSPIFEFTEVGGRLFVPYLGGDK